MHSFWTGCAHNIAHRLLAGKGATTLHGNEEDERTVEKSKIEWQCTNCVRGRGFAGNPCPHCGEMIFVQCPRCGHSESLPGAPCGACGAWIPESITYKIPAYIRLFRTGILTTCVVAGGCLVLGAARAGVAVLVIGGAFCLLVLAAMSPLHDENSPNPP